MLKFLSSFIPDVAAKPLVWDGSSAMRKRAVDPDSAFEWYRSAEKSVEWESCEVFLFGEKRVKLVPVLREEAKPSSKTEDMSKEFNEIVRTLSRG